MRAWMILALACVASGQSASELVSVTPSGGFASGLSSAPSLSDDGRFVAFESRAADLDTADGDDQHDIFVRDRLLGTTEIVSVNSSGNQVYRHSFAPDISGDGRFVAFSSFASDLVVGDVNGRIDVFVRDRQLGTTEIVSIATNGAASDGTSSNASISSDGRFVAFHSATTTLWPNAYGFHVYLRDRASGTTSLVSAKSDGTAPGPWSVWPAISGDGRWIAFHSEFAFVPNDTNPYDDIYLKELATGAMELVSVSLSGTSGNSVSRLPTISRDGRFVAFHSYVANLVPGDTNGKPDVFVRDRLSGTTVRASKNSNGQQSNGASYFGALSGDGTSMVFMSAASNFGPSAPNVDQAFWKNLVNGELRWASATYNGTQPNGGLYGSPAISADGRWSAFGASEDDILPGDTNGVADVFAWANPAPSTAVYCTAAITTHGCVPSIFAHGTPSASAGSGFTISVANVEQRKQGLLFYGITGALATPWGVGSTSFLCVKAPTQLMGSRHSSGGTSGVCDGALVEDWNAYITSHPSVLGQPFAGGETVWAQGWFRDPPAPKTTNLSNGLVFVVAP